MKNIFRNLTYEYGWKICSGIWSWLWVHKIVLTGGLPPPRPPAVPGGLPAPQTPWRGACSPPRPLADFWEAPPLKLSVFLDAKILAWNGTEICGTAQIIRAQHGNPPPPVKGGTGVFLTRHGTSESQILERRRLSGGLPLWSVPHSEIVEKWGSHFRPPFEHFWGPQKC